MNNDELQKAIDDITNNNAAAEAAAAADATASAAENEQLANELAGAAPAAAGTAEFAPAPAPAPEVPAEPGMPPVAGAPATAAVADVAPETEEAVAPAVEAIPTVEETPVAAPEIKLDAAPVADNATLEEAMRELYPLLDKVDMPLEEKFEITMKFGEPAKALELAKQMTDEAGKAKALLSIIEKLK